MSGFKFKAGDLVEVTKSKAGNIGHRFMVGNFRETKLNNEDGTKSAEKCKAYESDIKSVRSGRFKWSAERNLKLVNPDIDNISDESFSDILNEISQPKLISLEN
jgi:hypothetical protein